jgi:hypothetical protein
MYCATNPLCHIYLTMTSKGSGVAITMKETKIKARLSFMLKGKKRTNRKKSGFVATSNLPHSDTNRLLPNQTHLFHYQPPGFSRSYGL